MTLPLAASPTSPTPGLWLTVDLTPNTVSPGSQGLNILILAPKSSTGDITNDTEIRPVLSQADVERALGEGNTGSLAYLAALARWPEMACDVVSPTPSAGSAATGLITMSGTITSDYTVRYKIHGVIIDVPWLVGESAAQHHAKAVTYIGRYVKRLFVTPSVTTGVLLTAKVAGPAGNDVSYSVELIDGAGGSVTVAGAKLSGGSTEPDFTNALATVQGREYDFILACLSNADAASTSGNMPRLENHVDSLDSGPAAKLQQIIVGHTGARTAAAVSTAARNSQVIEVLNAQNAQALPAQVGGDELGDRCALVLLKISANRIGRPCGFVGSADPVSDHPTTAQSDAALLAGLSVVGYDRTGSPYLMRAVTSYCSTATGAQVPPTDCNEIDAMYQYAKDLRAFLPEEFAGVKIMRDRAEPDDELPEGVVEERDIRGSINARTESFWIPKGVINGTKWRAAVIANQLIVRVNATDETQVDCFIPAEPFKNLAKLGVYVQKTG